MQLPGSRQNSAQVGAKLLGKNSPSSLCRSPRRPRLLRVGNGWHHLWLRSQCRWISDSRLCPRREVDRRHFGRGIVKASSRKTHGEPSRVRRTVEQGAKLLGEFFKVRSGVFSVLAALYPALSLFGWIEG